MKPVYAVNIHRCSTTILVAVVLLMLLSLVLASDQPPVPLRPRNRPIPEAQKERIARRIAGGYGLGPFQPSIEMKENADFLVTPAILVQEAISDDIIMTYPTE